MSRNRTFSVVSRVAGMLFTLALLLNAGKASAVGLDITNRNDLVGIHYSLWFNPVVGPGATWYDNSQILAQSGATKTAPAWGPATTWHFWAKPQLGYYRSDNASVMRTHITQLQQAGVDFVIMDSTNSRSTWPASYYQSIFTDSATLFLNTLNQMRSEGLTTPYVVFWAGSWADDPAPSWNGLDIYNRFYVGGQYNDLFVYYSGKPFLLVTDTIPADLTQRFTIRKMWGLQGTLATNEWSYLQPHPQKVATNNEQISVSTAFQRDYISNFSTATPRRGGITFAAQWKRAFAVRPKIVTLTWWNEWMAQRQGSGVDGDGNASFVDDFTPEYSRDIEPMEGGHGDSYYQFMKNYIAYYKARLAFPTGLVRDAAPLGDFEIGGEGWKPELNVTSAKSNFSQGGSAVPVAFTGNKLLDIQGAAVAGSTPKRVARTFEMPVDFGDYTKFRFAISGWGGAPGATSYTARLILTSSTGAKLVRDTLMPNPSGWQDISIDFNGWPTEKNRVKKIEIAYIANGSTQAWAGKFFIDNVRLTKL